VCNVTDGTSSLGARRILMPESSANGQQEHREHSGTKAGDLKPTMMLPVYHHVTRLRMDARHEGRMLA